MLVTPTAKEARRLELISLSDSGMPGEVCAFIIKRHGAIGHLEAKLYTPNNKIEAVDVLPIDGNDSYCVRFIPLEVFFLLFIQFL